MCEFEVLLILLITKDIHNHNTSKNVAIFCFEDVYSLLKFRAAKQCHIRTDTVTILLWIGKFKI